LLGIILVHVHFWKENLGTFIFVKKHISLRGAWDELVHGGKAKEVIETYQLPYKTIKEAVKTLSKFFNMQLCDKSENINPSNKVHAILLAGNFLKTIPVINIHLILI
jgi:hypothetical protein